MSNVCIQNYYKIEDAINAKIDSKTAFIIANERPTRKGKVGRFFTVFPSMNSFLEKRDKYPHCHEIIVDHHLHKPNKAGRLVFDFDIKDKKIPRKFKQQVESTIVQVIDKYFKDIDVERFEYVWSTCENPKKFSKHLTVKNLYFDDWIIMSRRFYKLFSLIWDDTYYWIESRDLVDVQVVRNRASLRMVGSSKIGGNCLEFDDPKFRLTDSLIRIYFRQQRLVEQIVTIDNLQSGVTENVLNESDEYQPKAIQYFHFGNDENKSNQQPEYSKIVYKKAFELCNQLSPGIFSRGGNRGKTLYLVREREANCIMSGRVHQHENAFLRIEPYENTYLVYFTCFRYCYPKKSIFIGTIDIDTYDIVANTKYQKRQKKRKEYIIDFN